MYSYLTPKGVQDHCRNKRVWLNKVAVYQAEQGYILYLYLYKSYDRSKPKETLIQPFSDKGTLNEYVIRLWQLYPKLKVENEYLLF